ncbi:Trm112 family protein [Candidatus Micrarchaeota archaeon]|nr:Trm112 family protein [Candidatus Micrarchaeota archaeon]MBU1940032.1 Trm112 family protein [Candidatus Micrarchaeota archaeon]
MGKELSKELLEVLACPKCKSDLDYKKAKSVLACKNPGCKREYRVEDGIPIMLAEE